MEEKNADQQRTIREQNEKLSSVPKPVEKIVEVENPETKFRMAELERKIRSLTEERDTLKKETALNKEQAAKFEKLQNDISFLTRKKSDLFRQIESATELSGLTVRLQNILEKELAPIKFKRCMEELDNVNSQVCKNNLIEIIDKVKEWINEMDRLLTLKNNKNIEYEIDADFVQLNK